MTQAIILAGGKGTRLASVSGGLPKPLVPVAGTPIVERQIALLARYGVGEIFLTTGYRADLIGERLGDGSRLGVRLHHVHEATPLGTAGGLAALRDLLTGDFLVLYGDILFHMDLGRLLSFHRDNSAAATLVVHPNDHPYDSDLLELDDRGRVLAFHPKPRPADGPDLRNVVSAGIYALSAEALAHIEPNQSQDFVRDVFPRMLRAGSTLFGYRTTEYAKDMGTPDRLERVSRDVESGLVESVHRDHMRPTAFLDRDGVINAEIDGVHHPDQLQLLPGVGAEIRRLNQAGWLVATVTNQPDVAKGFLTEEDLEKIHRRLESRLGEERAWLDDLAYCPHHPESGFSGERPELKGPCTCRKPAPGMLESLSDYLPVEPVTSAMIGDSWRDMAAAHAFGVDAIGVLTGHGLEHPPPADRVLEGRPDLVVDGLGQAVSVLLEPDPGVEALLQRVLKELESCGNRPLVVLVGGLSRTGKSTAVFRLRRLLRRRNLGVLWVRLDDWLVPSDERPPHSTVAERFRLPEVERALETLASGEAVEAPGYDPRTRGALACRVPYDPQGAAVVVVEGVPALLLELGEVHHLRVNLDAANEEERERRLHGFYRSKGFSTQETRELLAARSEEHTLIAEAASSAHFRFEPRQFDAPTNHGTKP